MHAACWECGAPRYVLSHSSRIGDAVSATLRLQDMPSSLLRNPAPRVPTAAPNSQLSQAEVFGHLRGYYAKHAPGLKSDADLQATAGRVARDGTGRLNAPMKKKYGESFDEFVANAGSGHGRGTHNRNVAAFNNPMYDNEVSINVTSAPAAASPAHGASSSSSSVAAFVVRDRVEIVDKGTGTVLFVGLHHVQGTYGNSQHCLNLLHATMCVSFCFPRAPPRRAALRGAMAQNTSCIVFWDATGTFLLDRCTFWANVAPILGLQAPRGSESSSTPPTARTTAPSRAIGAESSIVYFRFERVSVPRQHVSIHCHAASNGRVTCLVTSSQVPWMLIGTYLRSDCCARLPSSGTSPASRATALL